MKSGACCSLVAVGSQVGLLRNPFSSQVRGRLLHESPLSDSRERSTLKAKRPDGNHKRHPRAQRPDGYSATATAETAFNRTVSPT